MITGIIKQDRYCAAIWIVMKMNTALGDPEIARVVKMTCQLARPAGSAQLRIDDQIRQFGQNFFIHGNPLP